MAPDHPILCSPPTNARLCLPLPSCRYEDISPSTHNMDVPHVKREDYQLTDISDDGYLTLMTDGGDLREDLKLPDGELGGQLRTEFDSGKELLVSTQILIPLRPSPSVPIPPAPDSMSNCSLWLCVTLF